MNSATLDRIVQQALAAGVLRGAAPRSVQPSRPWPVVLLTALGAWLAAIPLLFAVAMMLGNAITKGAGAYVVGVLLLCAAVAVLRARDLPFFIEQLMVPALLAGGGTLAIGLLRDLPMQGGAVLLALLACLVAWLVPNNWLRVLLGALAAVLSMLVCMAERGSFYFQDVHLADFWFALHASLAVFIIAHWIKQNVLIDAASARYAVILETLGAGWLLVTLTGLVWWSGMTFLLGGSLGGEFASEVARELAPTKEVFWQGSSQHVASAGLALSAAAWMARRWPGVRGLASAATALLLIGLSWLMPSLGAVLLVLAFCVSSGRWRVGAAAGVAGAWIIGSFYYQLNWALAMKAILLLGTGAVLGGVSWLAVLRDGSVTEQGGVALLPSAPAKQAPSASPLTQSGIALCILAVLAAVNLRIWQNEQLIARGTPVYIEMAPRDPRSLMQGDYMQMNFVRLTDPGTEPDRSLGSERPRVVARRGERGIAALLRFYDGTPLAPEEFLIELTSKDGRWILVSDAWFFKEGEADRWARAKYGEFRVGGDGRALLVGLRGAQLEPL